MAAMWQAYHVSGLCTVTLQKVLFRKPMPLFGYSISQIQLQHELDKCWWRFFKPVTPNTLTPHAAVCVQACAVQSPPNAEGAVWCLG